MTKLDLRTVLTLGTSHVTAEVRDWLNEQGEKAALFHRLAEPILLSDSPGLCMSAHVYGWTTYAHEPGEWVEPSTPAHVVECLEPIFAFAQKHGAYLIHFDGDADTVDGLPTYEW